MKTSIRTVLLFTTTAWWSCSECVRRVGSPSWRRRFSTQVHWWGWSGAVMVDTLVCGSPHLTWETCFHRVYLCTAASVFSLDEHLQSLRSNSRGEEDFLIFSKYLNPAVDQKYNTEPQAAVICQQLEGTLIWIWRTLIHQSTPSCWTPQRKLSKLVQVSGSTLVTGFSMKQKQ